MEQRAEEAQERRDSLVEELQPLASELGEVLGAEFKGLAACPAGPGGDPGARTGATVVMVLVERVTVAVLNRLRPVIARWSKRLGIDPVIVTPEEIETSVDVFPIEFLNLKAEGAFIGEVNPFAELKVDRESLRRQVEEDLKTKGLWLRGAFLQQGTRRGAVHGLLVEHFATLTVLLRSLLTLKGRALPPGTGEALQAVAEAYGVQAETLTEVASLQRTPPKGSQAEREDLFQRYHEVLSHIAEQVNNMADDTPAEEGGER
jgi:hypothetical protein